MGSLGSDIQTAKHLDSYLIQKCSVLQFEDMKTILRQPFLFEFMQS